MSDAPPPPPDGLEIFGPPPVPQSPEAVGVPAYGEKPAESLAHPGLRALAFLLDGLGTVAVTIAVVFGGLVAGSLEVLVAILYVPLASAVLATVLTATLGVTPGKWVARIRVVHVVTGRPIGFWAVPRSLVIVAPLVLTFVLFQVLARLPLPLGDTDAGLFGAVGIPALLWIALFVFVVTRPRHRGLEDLAGRSVVVRR